MAYSQKDWDIVQAFYESGLTLSEIVNNPKVAVKSKSQISKRAAKEGWQKETEKKRLIEIETEAKQQFAYVQEAKEKMSVIEVDVHNALVAERFVIVSELAKFSVKALRKGSLMLDEIVSPFEYKALAEGVDRVSITAGINERHAKPAQINNNTQTNNLASLTLDEVQRKIREIDERVINA